MKLWIARSKYGTLILFHYKPVKIGEEWFGESYMILDSVHWPTFGKVTPFPDVTFENSPQQIELKLIKEE